MEIILWENERGDIPVGEFIEARDEKAQDKILWKIDRLREYGMVLRKHSNHAEKLTGYQNTFFTHFQKKAIKQKGKKSK